MAAAYLFSRLSESPIRRRHKRTGANSVITFLLINDWEPDFSEDELVDLVLSVASGVMSKSALTKTFEAVAVPHQTCSWVSGTA